MTEDKKEEELKRRIEAKWDRLPKKDTAELGRELFVSELKPGTIVVVQPPAYVPIYFSLWVQEVTANTVTFYSGELHTAFKNFRQPDGTLTDDKQRRVRIFEYRGDV